MFNSKNNLKITLQKAGLSWFGQMAASLFWLASVFIYGVSSMGDVLQLLAALAWMIANLAALTDSQLEIESPYENTSKMKESNGN